MWLFCSRRPVGGARAAVSLSASASHSEAATGESIDQPLLDARVSIDPAIAQERPVGPRDVDATPVDLRHHDFLAIDAAFRENLATRGDDETLSPELDPIAAGRRFLTDAIDRGDI